MHSVTPETPPYSSRHCRAACAAPRTGVTHNATAETMSPYLVPRRPQNLRTPVAARTRLPEGVSRLRAAAVVHCGGTAPAAPDSRPAVAARLESADRRCAGPSEIRECRPTIR